MTRKLKVWTSKDGGKFRRDKKAETKMNVARADRMMAGPRDDYTVKRNPKPKR